MTREAERADAEAIAEIYNHYVLESVATFEESPVQAAEVAQRLEKVRALGLPWLVSEETGQLVGYAYATEWRPRSAYRHTVEVSIYLHPACLRQGWGTRLYTRLFELLEARPFHAVIGGITLPNPASVALHEKFGLRKVAHFPEVGFKFGRWLDVGYWEKTYPA